jgi:hypothetical protein
MLLLALFNLFYYGILLNNFVINLLLILVRFILQIMKALLTEPLINMNNLILLCG